MNATTYDELIAGFYNAASGRGSWDDALKPLAKGLDLWGVQALGVDKRTGTLLFSFEAGPASPEARLDYIRKYHAMNPRIEPSMALRAGEWFHDHEVFDEEYVSRSAFYQEFLIPHGGRYCTGTKMVDDEQSVVFFAALRGVGQPPITREEMPLVERITFHVTEAMRNYMQLRASPEQFNGARQLLDQFNYPMFLVDEQRLIRCRNRLADALLDRADVVVERAGFLACRDPQSDGRMLLAIRALDLATGKGPARRFQRIETVDDRIIGLYAVAIRPDTAMGTFGPIPVALLIFHDPRRQPQIDAFIVGEMFDLTPAEARVATSIAKGRTPEEIAVATRISVATVRAQIKSIFAKTDVRRQSELVALLRGMPDLYALRGAA